MNKKYMTGASRMQAIFLGLGALACLIAMGFGFFIIQKESAQESSDRLTADQMRVLAQRITDSARRTISGDEAVFNDLAGQVENFESLLGRMQSAELAQELSQVEISWQPVKRAAQKLVDAGPLIVFMRNVSSELERDIRPMQSEFSAVVDKLRTEKYSAPTILAAQKPLWLIERIGRNVDRILAGEDGSESAGLELRADAAEFIHIVEALTRGDVAAGIRKVPDADSMESLTTAFSMFSIVSTAIERIAGSAMELGQAQGARDTVEASAAALSDSLSALVPAINRLAVGRLDDRGTLLALFVAPCLFALVLLAYFFIDQRHRALKGERGAADINAALQRIAGGDLTAHISNDVSRRLDIAREINTVTDRQRKLIKNISRPFALSLEEINKIGRSARALVEKGKALTSSVVESTEAATEMVRTSEEIKASTVEAARTSDRNCQRVAQGYELTKDMSKASADVRESVQETSKSAKRQGELIQSVTAAAEYIQALNTKISVVAINTRIEAEKAGEYGRPFLGIAEAIADLLREAGEEGRKIISEVRMLQNMSAENLASMENTVGTVVTILEYIERLDSSLEEINSGSAAISSIIRSVDDAAGQSAISARHMNNSMAEISDRNIEISKFSESTCKGVSTLQISMQEAAHNLDQFRIDGSAPEPETELSELDDLAHIPVATKIYREEDMSALELTGEARALV